VKSSYLTDLQKYIVMLPCCSALSLCKSQFKAFLPVVMRHLNISKIYGICHAYALRCRLRGVTYPEKLTYPDLLLVLYAEVQSWMGLDKKTASYNRWTALEQRLL
jgi:hypothetical protein